MIILLQNIIFCKNAIWDYFIVRIVQSIIDWCLFHACLIVADLWPNLHLGMRLRIPVSKVITSYHITADAGEL